MISGPQVATARDGRTLTFAEWGDPAGFPVFSLHGTPGSRFTRHYDESVYTDVGARVVTYNRPGYGESTRHRGRRIVDCVDDVADRAELPTDDLRGGDPSDHAAAFSSYFAYCGTYEIKGNTVVHSVTMSLVPNWVGSSQVRYFEVNDDELVLRTPPIEVRGQLLVHEFRWQRDE